MLKNGKMLVKYKRKRNRVPIATIVAIGPGIVGWSICDKHDTFVKSVGIDIAFSRAQDLNRMSRREALEYYLNSPETLKNSIIDMYARSYAYFE